MKGLLLSFDLIFGILIFITALLISIALLSNASLSDGNLQTNLSSFIAINSRLQEQIYIYNQFGSIQTFTKSGFLVSKLNLSKPISKSIYNECANLCRMIYRKGKFYIISV